MLVAAECAPATPAKVVATQSHVVFDPLAGKRMSDPVVLTFRNIGEEATPALAFSQTGEAAFVVGNNTCAGAILQHDKECSVSVEIIGDVSGVFQGQLRVHALPLIDARGVARRQGDAAAALVHLAERDEPRGCGGTECGRVALHGAEFRWRRDGTDEGRWLNGAGFSTDGRCTGALAAGETCRVSVYAAGVGLDTPPATINGWVTATAEPGGLARADFLRRITEARSAMTSDYTWDSVASHQSVSHTFSIVAPGPEALETVMVQLSEDAPQIGSFVVESDNCSAPSTPSRACSVTVAATGMQTGTYTGKLTVKSRNYKPAIAALTAIVH